MFNNAKSIKNLKKIEKNLSNSIYYTTHKNWKSTFNNQKKLNKKNLDFFLNTNKKIAFGIGVTSNNLKDELESFKFLYNIQLTSNPKIKQFLNRIKCEKILGEVPIIYGNLELTRSNLMNAESLFYLKELIPELNKKENIKILEIGGGYGELCRQILKYSELDVLSYHLIDLPKNLLFSEKYLSEIFSKSVNIKSRISDFESSSNNRIEIKFFLPNELPKDIKYDLIINTYSLQEMNIETASAYFKYIEKSLDDDGYFYSINSPKKWSISSYVDYNELNNLENKHSVMHRQIPPSIEGTVPIVNIFKTSKKNYNSEDLDFISKLQDRGFTNLLNKVLSEFNISQFTTKSLEEQLKDCNVFDIENTSVKELTDKNLLYYFVNILIYDRQFDMDYGLLLLKELVETKNTTVSLKLIYEFSKKINKKLSVDQIKDFIYI